MWFSVLDVGGLGIWRETAGVAKAFVQNALVKIISLKIVNQLRGLVLTAGMLRKL